MIMTTFEVKRNPEGAVCGFKVSGHSGFDVVGRDIVCASISTLVINFINSVECFTDLKFKVDSDEEKGIIDLDYISEPDDYVKLLYNSLLLGLGGIQEEYSKELKIID